jgi:hypothetical protein
MDNKIITKSWDFDGTQYFVFNPDPIMGSTAVMIVKSGKALLINAQFTNANGNDIAQFIEDKEYDLTAILITYSDPDFYFGLTEIEKHFPDTPVYATDTTIKRIKASAENKIDTWKETLKDNTPKNIIYPDHVIENKLVWENLTFKLVGVNLARGAFYDEVNHVLFGSINIFDNTHVFLADTAKDTELDSWIQDLKAFNNIDSAIIIPAHFGNNTDFNEDNSLSFTEKYIKAFEKNAADSQSADQLIEKMKAAYPDLGGEANLDLSARVFMNEMDWQPWSLDTLE